MVAELAPESCYQSAGVLCLRHGLLTWDYVTLQEALGDESADQVSVNFFGDGTCNVGKQTWLVPVPAAVHARKF